MSENAITMGLNAFGNVIGLGHNMDRFQWEKQKAEAELSNLPLKTQADASNFRNTIGENDSAEQLRPLKTDATASRYRDIIGENEASAKLRPIETENKMREATNKAYSLDAAGARLPTVERTNDVNAAVGLQDAQTRQTIQPVKSETAVTQANIDKQTTDNQFANLAESLRQGNEKGILNKYAQADVMFANIGRLLADGRHGDAKAFANEVIKNKGLFPATNDLGEVTDIKSTPQGVQFTFSNSEPMTVPADAFRAAMQRAQKGEFGHAATKDGGLYLYDKHTGRTQQVVKGDPAMARGQHTPAEIQTMEYLVSKGVAKNTEQAWDMVRSSREKTRSAFIMDYVSKNAINPKQAEALKQQAGELYDSLKGSDAPAQVVPQGSNTGAGSKLLNKLGLP